MDNTIKNTLEIYLGDDIDFKGTKAHEDWYIVAEMNPNKQLEGIAYNINGSEEVYLVTGFFEEGMGITLVYVPLISDYCPFVFRGIKSDSNNYQGDAFRVDREFYFIPNISPVNKVIFGKVGQTNITVMPASDMSNEEKIEFKNVTNYAKDTLSSDYFKKIMENAKTQEGIDEIKQDLENFYYRQTGKFYE